MKLKDLIRGKRENGNLATATSATSATNEHEESGTVAKVATVSVANPWKDKSEELQISRHEAIEQMLMSEPESKYAVLVDDAATDPITVTVGIRRIAIFDLQIPLAHYDGLGLLQVIEQYSAEK